MHTNDTPEHVHVCIHCKYSPTPVIRTSVIRNLDYPNAVLNVESLRKNGILTKIAESATEQCTCVCVSYVHVQCSRAVVRHRVQCESVKAFRRDRTYFLCYIIVCT